MGVERTVELPNGIPNWPTVAAILKQGGETPIIRMIDGLPAFPDEQPEESWQELRVSLSGGMITMRRGTNLVKCVTWGTGDPALEQSCQQLVEAWTKAGES